MAITKVDLFLVLDVESIGLHGEGFAAGYVVIDAGGVVVEEWSAICPPLAAKSQLHATDASMQWVQANVPLQPYADTYAGPDDLRGAFWLRWMRWKALGATMVADCPWPVEARFLAECVDDRPRDREWEGPYPLLDVASVLYALGGDPLANHDRRPDELPAHHPLHDARQSARLLVAALQEHYA